MYCYDNSTDGYHTGTCDQALQDEGFGIYASNTNCPITSGSGQLNSSNDVSYDSPRPSNWNKGSVCVQWLNMAKYTWILSASLCITQFFRPITWCKRIQVQ